MEKHSIFLKGYHCPDGRTIHYSTARLRNDPASDTGTSVIDVDNANDITSNIPCWIFFYPAGPNRRLLEAVISRYSPHFENDGDVLFLCINRPGKGGTSSPLPTATSSKTTTDNDVTPEKVHIATACQDIVTILDHYKISKTSLIYMCAGSTFAYSFATKFPDRCTGNIVGIATWILRSDDGNNDDENEIVQPRVHSLTHRLAMEGKFGPKWMVSSVAGGLVGSATGLLNVLPKKWAVNAFKKGLSEREKREFEEQYPDKNGEGLVELMHWIHSDNDGEGSKFVNDPPNDNEGQFTVGITCNESGGGTNNKKDGDARDVAVCLSTQQELGLIYKTTIPEQENLLLWHGENDPMISVLGAEWLAHVIPAATLTTVPGGTHNGTMFFFPKEVMETINELSA